MKILLAYTSVSLTANFGGAEKVLYNFANEFVRRGFEVAVVYDEKGDAASPYPLDGRVRLRNLKTREIKFSALFLAAKIWRELVKPLRKTALKPLFPDVYRRLRLRRQKSELDVVLNDFAPDVVLFFSIEDAKAFFFRRPTLDFATIQMLHNVPSVAIPPRRQAENAPALDRCDVVQALLPSFVPAVRAQTSSAIVALPNVVPQFPATESVDVDERERAGSPRIVSAGRFDKRQKRQHLAIEAFAKIADACPDWTLRFYGDEVDPAYRRKLERAISERGLQDRVFLCRPTPDIYREFAQSDIFAFPSAYEGFSLALTEAQSLGLPAVGFADAPSVNELIIDGENGFLATDVDDFAQKLKTLIDSKELRRRFGADAKKAVEKYEASKVWDAWEKLLRETVEQKRAQNADARADAERR